MKITQAFTFESAHRLPNVPATHRCHRMHGHSYRVEHAFAPLLAQLDHHCLNEVEGLENPTAENIAVWIWDRIRPTLRQIAAVVVFETSNCWAEYQG
jgi:6-pyruvoyltetrahydropterin/6-carboxytetrahydropterin synthase